MSPVLPAALAGVAVALAGALPAAATLRLRALPALGPLPAAQRAAPWRRTVPVAAGVGGLLLLGPAGAGLTALAAFAALRVLAARSAAAVRTQERRRAVEACAVLAAELRAGRTSAQALGASSEVAVGACRQALLTAARAAHWGGDVAAALLAAATASAVPEVLRALAACWQVCDRSGSGLAAAIDRLADGLRARQAQELAISAALAGPRASAGLLAMLPLAGMALAAGLGAHPVHVLLHTPLGVGCLFAGAALDALGLWWTTRLVSSASRVGG